MDDFAVDEADLVRVVESSERGSTSKAPSAVESRPSHAATKVQQPKPQSLPNRSGPSHILVSPRQKGNSVLKHIQGIPWEFEDIPADYVMGSTTCALFLSLKYHRLHPEYIDGRIRALGHKYNLRVLLTLVDINDHEDPLRALSKTSLINDLTLILCWSAAEAGRYLELFKSKEYADASSIRAHQASSYGERLVQFITTPRNINKTDANTLMSNFGSLHAAITARPEEIDMIGGWGDRKVHNWCTSVREPFRARRAARRGPMLSRDTSRLEAMAETEQDSEPSGLGQEGDEDKSDEEGHGGDRSGDIQKSAGETQSTSMRTPDDGVVWEADADEEEAMLEAALENPRPSAQPPKRRVADEGGDAMSEGVMAALARLREKG